METSPTCFPRDTWSVTFEMDAAPQFFDSVASSHGPLLDPERRPCNRFFEDRESDVAPLKKIAFFLFGRTLENDVLVT